MGVIIYSAGQGCSAGVRVNEFFAGPCGRVGFLWMRVKMVFVL